MIMYYMYKGALFAGHKLLDSKASFDYYCEKLLASADSDPAIESEDMLDLYDYVDQLRDQPVGR